MAYICWLSFTLLYLVGKFIVIIFQPGPSQTCEGYNSEDEYSHMGVNLTEDEWLEKDRKFERTMKKKGTSSNSKCSLMHHETKHYFYVKADMTITFFVPVIP